MIPYVQIIIYSTMQWNHCYWMNSKNLPTLSKRSECECECECDSAIGASNTWNYQCHLVSKFCGSRLYTQETRRQTRYPFWKYWKSAASKQHKIQTSVRLFWQSTRSNCCIVWLNVRKCATISFGSWKLLFETGLIRNAGRNTFWVLVGAN